MFLWNQKNFFFEFLFEIEYTYSSLCAEFKSGIGFEITAPVLPKHAFFAHAKEVQQLRTQTMFANYPCSAQCYCFNI